MCRSFDGSRDGPEERVSEQQPLTRHRGINPLATDNRSDWVYPRRAHSKHYLPPHQKARRQWCACNAFKVLSFSGGTSETAAFAAACCELRVTCDRPQNGHFLNVPFEIAKCR